MGLSNAEAQECFDLWARTPGQLPDSVAVGGRRVPVAAVFAALAGSDDTMPRHVADAVYLPAGSTYAQAVADAGLRFLAGLGAAGEGTPTG